MNVASDKQHDFSNGWVGWIHAEATPQGKPERPATPPPKMSSAEVTKMAKAMFAHEMAPSSREAMADVLGVSVESLELLRMGYGEDMHGQFGAFPMRSENLEIIGISRRYHDGSKLSGYGMSVGVFCEPEWHKRQGPVLILEGASDVAAAITLGLSAIGRFNNLAGADILSEMRKKSGRQFVVVGENDEKPSRRGAERGCKAECGGCATCWPGKFGAMTVAKRIEAPYVMPPPEIKDFRELAKANLPWNELIRGLSWS